MLPNYVVQETTVRESGESAVFPLGEYSNSNLLITLGITHAMEQQSLDLDVYCSGDGKTWQDKPMATFPSKFYCGTYQLSLPPADGRFVKAVWRVNRWGRGQSRPLFRFYVCAEPARDNVFAGAA